MKPDHELRSFKTGSGQLTTAVCVIARVAGTASSEIIALMEYVVAVLGTPITTVIGHAGSGAVKAAIAASVRG